MNSTTTKITKLAIAIITVITIYYLASARMKKEDPATFTSKEERFDGRHTKLGGVSEMGYVKTTSRVVATEKKKIVTNCGETEDDFKMTSLDLVRSLLSKVPEKNKLSGNKEPLCRQEIKPVFDNGLTKEENDRKQKCIKGFKSDHQKGSGQFWSGDTQYLRHKHHRYLNENSVVLDIGGNKGEDAEALLKSYNPGTYVILEPIKTLFNALVKMFEKNKNVILYDFGLGRKNDNFFVNVVGHGGDATSIFIENKQKGSCLLRVFNTTEFMIRLGVACFEVDLITINCEGCEFDILETLLSTDIINRFRHVQFATHPTLKHLNQPAERYCEIQEKLSRTHVISYQYKFCWETWKRKDLA